VYSANVRWPTPLVRNTLDEADRHELLLRIACDDAARQLLKEMLLCQGDARAAFGYDGADAAIEASLKRLRENPSAQERRPPPSGD